MYKIFFKKQKHNFVRAAIHTAYTIPGLNGSQNRGTNFDCFYGFESPRNRKKEKQVYIITPKCNLISKFMDIFHCIILIILICQSHFSLRMLLNATYYKLHGIGIPQKLPNKKAYW